MKQDAAQFDLAVIGGGINGSGIARDAAGRGLAVILIEQDDLASGTSSKSSKLIHGGLRYLEHGEFRLVRESLREREELLRAAPHLVRPLRFVLPIDRSLRSPLMLRLGLLIYDRIGRRKILPGTRTVDLQLDGSDCVLQPRFRAAYEYSDCFGDDARLVMANAIDAAARGAAIRLRTRLVSVERGALWRLALATGGQREFVTARILVNAAGPWAEAVTATALREQTKPRLRLDKGTHIVVRRSQQDGRAYILQASDRRVVFAIPFERDFILIGTTDVSFSGDPATVTPTGEEIAYLCSTVNRYFVQPINPADVIWAYAGVRALYDDGARRPQDIGRDHTLLLDHRNGHAPLLTVYGGKITTYRRLAENALAKLAGFLPPSMPWTSGSALPGGNFAHDGFDALRAHIQRHWPFLTTEQACRMTRAYGTRIAMVLAGAKRFEDLGVSFGGGLTEAEVRYLMTEEWAITADDVLWRRSKLGLRFSEPQRRALEKFMAEARRT